MAFSKWLKKCELERFQRWTCTRTCSHRTTHRDIAAAEEDKCCFPHSWSWRLPFESAGRIRFTCRFFRRNIFVGTMLVRVIGVPSTFTNSDTSLHPFFSYFSLGLSTCRTNPQPLAIAIPWPAGIPKGHICRRTMPTLSGSCQCLSAAGLLVSIFLAKTVCNAMVITCPQTADHTCVSQHKCRASPEACSI